MAVEVHRKLFTIDEYHRMFESGILSEDDRVELVEGEIIETGAKGSSHSTCVKRITYRVRQESLVDIEEPNIILSHP